MLVHTTNFLHVNKFCRLFLAINYCITIIKLKDTSTWYLESCWSRTCVDVKEAINHSWESGWEGNDPRNVSHHGYHCCHKGHTGVHYYLACQYCQWMWHILNHVNVLKNCLLSSISVQKKSTKVNLYVLCEIKVLQKMNSAHIIECFPAL